MRTNETSSGDGNIIKSHYDDGCTIAQIDTKLMVLSN